jgi:hypothetical protein
MSLSLWRNPDSAEPSFELEPHLIEARFQWARKQGHPGYLWPELPLHAWRACLFEIERAVAKVLAGERGVRLEAPESAGARGLGIAAFTSGTGPLLGHWLQRGYLTAAEDIRQLLSSHYAHSRARANRLDDELRRALAVLGNAGIDVTVIKGAYTAHRYFADPGDRPIADVDIVVDPGRGAAASAALEKAGYLPTIKQRHPFKCDWVPPGAPTQLRSLELTHQENPYAIELHESLDRVFDGVRTIRLGDVRAHSEPWPALGSNARRLRQPVLFALLALHASEELHLLQLIRVIELVEVMRRDFRAAGNWTELIALLEQTDACRFVYPAIELSERLAPGTVDPDFRRRIAQHAHPRLVRLVDRTSPATAQRVDRLSLEERMLWADGPIETIRRLAYLAWPVRARNSRRPLRSVYRDRFYRLLRGRLGWQDR